MLKQLRPIFVSIAIYYTISFFILLFEVYSFSLKVQNNEIPVTFYSKNEEKLYRSDILISSCFTLLRDNKIYCVEIKNKKYIMPSLCVQPLINNLEIEPMISRCPELQRDGYISFCLWFFLY